MDLALNNLQRLIYHKTQRNQQTNQPTNDSEEDFKRMEIFFYIGFYLK